MRSKLNLHIGGRFSKPLSLSRFRRGKEGINCQALFSPGRTWGDFVSCLRWAVETVTNSKVLLGLERKRNNFCFDKVKDLGLVVLGKE